MRSRREIIKEALKVQIDTSPFAIDIFTSEDVLALVGIGKREVESLKDDFNNRIDEFLESIGIN